MEAKVLKLDKAGTPQEWIAFHAAATAIAKGSVLWELGDVARTMFGGVQKSGEQSRIELPAIIAVQGKVAHRSVPKISNELLFSRDGHMCMYCGQSFGAKMLSRDHIKPTSKGGPDTWENCVTSCLRCNHFKADRTPEEAGLELIAVPFAPNMHEYLFLDNRNVLIDQMDYLKTQFKHVMIS